jgi:hypothetical protein
LTRAIEAAAEADVAIVIVGTTPEWESEGFDRRTLSLPGQQDRLIEQVAAVNPNTIVVVNSGAPVTMPWSDAVNAIAQLWFGGQEMAAALADVVVGAVDPGGRLPTTMPLLLEHNPSFGNFPGEFDEVRYGEGLFVGYRWYEARHLPVRFAFGHGLSYSSFSLGTPLVLSSTFQPGDTLDIELTVTNTGERAGSEVVQCYVAPPRTRVTRPPGAGRDAEGQTVPDGPIVRPLGPGIGSARRAEGAIAVRGHHGRVDPTRPGLAGAARGVHRAHRSVVRRHRAHAADHRRAVGREPSPAGSVRSRRGHGARWRGHP